MTSYKAGTNNAHSSWPIFLVGLSVVIFLSWQLWIGIREYQNGIQLFKQQEALALQAGVAERELRSLMMELLTLAESDADARRIVNKYNIQFTPPPE